MIDFQSEIYTAVKNRVKSQFPSVYVTGEVSRKAAKLPCLQIEEITNTDTELDNGPSQYALLQYRVAALSSKTAGKKSEARAILMVADEALQELNFRRTSMATQSELYNSSAYRIEAIYSAAIDADGRLYLRR